MGYFKPARRYQNLIGRSLNSENRALLRVKMKHRQAGIGILEVVVASAILAILLLGTSSMIVSSQSAAQSVQKRLDSVQLQSFIGTILSNPAVCSNPATGLKNQPAPPLTPPGAPDVVSVPTLTFAGQSFDDSGGPNSFFDNGQIKIEELKYHAVTDLGGGVYSVKVRLQVNAQGAGVQAVVGGNLLAPVDFPVVLNIAGGVITSCGGSSSVGTYYVKTDPALHMGSGLRSCNNPADIATSYGCHANSWGSYVGGIPVGSPPNAYYIQIQWQADIDKCYITCLTP